MMKALKMTYWVMTGLGLAGILASTSNLMFNPVMKIGYAHIGFPDWFRVELDIANPLGAIALIAPIVSGRIREWLTLASSPTFSRLRLLIMRSIILFST